jgi:hypothetical protein
MRDALEPIIAKVWRHCQATGIRGRTVTLKVKVADFQQITRSKSVGDAIDSLADLERLSLGLLEPLLPTEKGGTPARYLAFVFDANAGDRTPPTRAGALMKTAALAALYARWDSRLCAVFPSAMPSRLTSLMCEIR